MLFRLLPRRGSSKKAHVANWTLRGLLCEFVQTLAANSDMTARNELQEICALVTLSTDAVLPRGDANTTDWSGASDDTLHEPRSIRLTCLSSGAGKDKDVNQLLIVHALCKLHAREAIRTGVCVVVEQVFDDWDLSQSNSDVQRRHVRRIHNVDFGTAFHELLYQAKIVCTNSCIDGCFLVCIESFEVTA